MIYLTNMKVLSNLLFLFICSLTYSQIPYFGESHKSDSFYGYHSIKINDDNGIHYTTFQYGLTDWLTIGTDLYNGNDLGGTLRLGKKFNKYISLGIQSTSVLDMKSKFNYSYQSTGLFINGYLTDRLFYVYNNWFTDLDYDNWYYLGYDLGNISILAGYTDNTKISGGIYYIHNKYIWYAWYNQDKTITLGLDFRL